ncbi:MAG: hypothetical protein DK305_000572 [Chloroflexi bacterium]|jgi:hypothetical protein|nr:MAG: hypothetical protein DK305_000572 [Chloroflexota bacterium]|tara:strand:+ start:667 stop:1488 length:822 start_codon:yes stop_codon:yes gene_type:complete
MDNSFQWNRSRHYKLSFIDNDIDNTQHNFHFLTKGKKEFYSIYNFPQAPAELGLIGSSIRNRELEHALLVKNERTLYLGNEFHITHDEIISAAEERPILPNDDVQFRSRIINDILIERLEKWIHLYGLLHAKNTKIFLTEWVNSILMFDWIYDFAWKTKHSLFRISDDNNPEYKENQLGSIPVNEASKLIKELIDEQLEKHTFGSVYDPQAKTLLGALWIMTDRNLRNIDDVFLKRCINIYTPCFRYITKNNKDACSVECEETHAYWNKLNNN